MGRAGKWLRFFLGGKKEKEQESKNQSASAPVPAPSLKKKRWSFRRPVSTVKEPNTAERAAGNGVPEFEHEQKRQAVAVAVAAAAAADAAVAAAQAAAAVVRPRGASNGSRISKAIEEGAAIKIQAHFRSFLARKALCALKGLVKLQALVRGHLARRQAAETLQCLKALLAAQARARVQRIQMAEDAQSISQRQQTYNRRSPLHPSFQQSYEMEKNAEENIKIVEMDLGEPRSNSNTRNSYSIPQPNKINYRHSIYYHGARTPSPSKSALTDVSPRTCSGHFEEFSFRTAESSPQYFSTHSSIDCQLFPNYMANTESSRLKARSQSAPRQRLESYERQSSRRRPSVEGRNIPRSVKMQRSSSQGGLSTNEYHQFPWHLKLDRSNVSIKDTECGSTNTVLTNTNYCRSIAGYEVYGNQY